MESDKTTHIETEYEQKKELCTIFINKLHVCNLWPKQFLFSVNFNSRLLPPFQKRPFNWVGRFTSLRCDMMTSVVVTCFHMSATLVCLVNNIPIITTFTIHQFSFPKRPGKRTSIAPPKKMNKIIKHDTTGPLRARPGNNNQNFIFILHD